MFRRSFGARQIRRKENDGETGPRAREDDAAPQGLTLRPVAEGVQPDETRGATIIRSAGRTAAPARGLIHLSRGARLSLSLSAAEDALSPAIEKKPDLHEHSAAAVPPPPPVKIIDMTKATNRESGGGRGAYDPNELILFHGSERNPALSGPQLASDSDSDSGSDSNKEGEEDSELHAWELHMIRRGGALTEPSGMAKLASRAMHSMETEITSRIPSVPPLPKLEEVYADIQAALVEAQESAAECAEISERQHEVAADAERDAASAEAEMQTLRDRFCCLDFFASYFASYAEWIDDAAPFLDTLEAASYPGTTVETQASLPDLFLDVRPDFSTLVQVVEHLQLFHLRFPLDYQRSMESEAVLYDMVDIHARIGLLSWDPFASTAPATIGNSNCTELMLAGSSAAGLEWFQILAQCAADKSIPLMLPICSKVIELRILPRLSVLVKFYMESTGIGHQIRLKDTLAALATSLQRALPPVLSEQVSSGVHRLLT